MPIKFYNDDGDEVSEINEGENVDIDITLTDEDGETTTPTSLSWWWTDAAGSVVNDREEVAATPADPTVVKLTPDDTALTSNADAVRVFSVKAVYSSSRGTGRTATEWGSLVIRHSKVI